MQDGEDHDEHSDRSFEYMQMVMPYRMYVTRELQIFTYENEPLQIKYECPQKPSYYQAKGPSAYIWPTNSPNQIE